MCFFAFFVTLQTRYDLSLFSIISIIFFSVSWKIVLKPIKNIKWRQEICCMITNWRKNLHHGISQLIQYFSIRLYTLVSFYGNIFSPSCLLWKVLWIWWYIWSFLKIKSKYKMSKGQWAQVGQAHNKSIDHFFFWLKDEMQNGSFIKQNITLTFQKKSVVLDVLVRKVRNYWIKNWWLLNKLPLLNCFALSFTWSYSSNQNPIR